FERTGLFARLHEVHVQIVEVERMLAERLVERRAAFDISLDVEHQLLHCRLVMPVADDFERLHQRNAGGEHGGELAAEDRDVFRLDLAAALEERALLADLDRDDSLAAQVGAQSLLTGGETSPLELVALLVLAHPVELDVFADRRCALRHEQMSSMRPSSRIS